MAGHIGKYQLLEEIGRGGFGIVYRAFDPTVNRTVAIKVLTVAGDEELLSRFRNEAAAAGNLHHANIVTVHEFGQSEQGMPFMVMQFLEGETLQAIIQQRKQLSLLQKMSIMWQVAEGLNHAHEHGVVHRDVKPPNIMVLPDESVQMMDFGIARMTTSTKHQTRTGFVVGTPLYMAPEQFLPGKTVDYRADIWAYGVIYYELLSGKNPFAAPEDATILYQIAHVEPPPLRSVAPAVPPALEEVIHRLLAKDPEYRYTSLRDVQFDVQPILVDLKRERADELMADAREYAEQDRLEEAQATAQSILRLDPANREAHSLLSTVKQKLMRRQIQPKIDTLLQKADEEESKRNYAGTVEALEAVARLAPSDTSIRIRLEQSRNLLQQSRRCEKLMADAEREIRAQNLTSALRMASEAVQVDPGNTTAGKLLFDIQKEMEVREAKRRTEEAINKARGLMLLQQYDDAIIVLSDLAGTAGDNPVVAELLAGANREKDEQLRRQRRSKDLGASREALKERRFEDAVRRLEKLAADFAGDVEVDQLLRYARGEYAYQQRTEAVMQLVKEAEALQANEDYDSALRLIERSLGEYPGEPSLVRMVQSVTVARAAWQRRMAVDRCLAETATLRKEGRLEQAVQRVSATLAEFNDEAGLIQLRGELQREWQSQQRAETIRRAIEQAQSHLKAGHPGQAAAVLEPVARDHPDEQTVTSLLANARAARDEQERQRFIDTALRSAGDREQRQDLRGALAIVEKALGQRPGVEPLAAAAERLRSEVAKAERSEDLARLVSGVESAIRAGDFERAIREAESGRIRFPEEHRFDQFVERARGGQRSAELNAVSSRIREAHRAGQAEECRKMLEEASARYGTEPAIQELRRQIVSDAVQRGLSSAEEEMRSGRYEAAQSAVQGALRWSPNEPSLTALAKRIDRERDLAAVDARVNELCSTHDYETAAKALKVARQRYPDEPRLAGRELEVQTILETERTRRQYDSAIDDARAAFERGDFVNAEALAAKALAANPADASAQSLIESARSQAQIAHALEEASRLMASGELARAREAVANTLARFPADARLQNRLEEIRSKMYAEAVEHAQASLQAGRTEDAAEAAQRALNHRPGDPTAASLLNSIRQTRLLGDRIASIRRTASEHGALAALEAVSAAQRDYGKLPEIEALDREFREQAYAESVDKAKAKLEGMRLGEARDAVQKALVARPNDATATSLLRHIDLEREITIGVEAVESALESADLEKARTLVANALRMYPGERRFLEMQAKVAARVESAVALERRQIAQLIGGRQYERALAAVADVQKRFGTTPELEQDRAAAAKAWDDQKKSDQDFESDLRRGGELKKKADIDGVRALAADLLRRRPDEPRARQLLEWAEGEFAGVEAELQRAGELKKKGDIEGAKALAAGVLRRKPDEVRARQLLEWADDEAKAREAAGREFQQAIEADLKRAGDLRRKGDIEGVRALAGELLRRKPDEARARQLLEWADAEAGAAKAREATARQLDQAIEADLVRAGELKKQGNAEGVRAIAADILRRKLNEERARGLLEWAEGELRASKAKRAAAAVAVGAQAKPPAPPAPEKKKREIVLPPLPVKVPEKSRGLVYGSIAGGVVILILVIGVMVNKGSPPPAQPATQVAQTPQEPATTPPPETAATQPPVDQPQVSQPAATQPTAPAPSQSKPAAAPPAAAKPATVPSTPAQQQQPAQQQPVPAQVQTPVQTPVQPPVQQQPPTPAVKDAGSGQVVQAPPQTPVQAPTGRVSDTGPWLGRKTGKLSWSGAVLPANGRIVLSTKGVIEGGGEVDADTMPAFTRVNIRVASPRDKVAVSVLGPNSVAVTNTSGAPIHFVELSWDVKP